MEIPSTENVIFEAVNWLIGLDNVSKAELVQETSDSE